MNTFSRFKSIKLKLMSVILVVTFISLFLGFASFFLVLSYNLKDNLETTMETKARLLAEFCIGPMEFDRREYVRDEVLSKLNNIPEVVCARVTNRNNELFAFYQSDCPPPLGIEVTGQNASVFQDEYLHVIQKIEFEGEYYGTIYLMVSTDNMNAELYQFIIWLLGVVAVITVISILSANRLQRIISGPVKRLAGVTSKVSHDGDYSVRVEKESDDEVGELYDSFNHMLSQIAFRQEEERKNKRALEISESKYRNIYQNSMVGIFRYDFKKNIISEANERTWEILGQQHIEQPIFGNILSIRDGIRIRNKLKRKGLIDSYELYVLTEEDDKIWLSLSGKSFEEQGFFEGVIKDVTEEKESFLELKRVNFELDNFVYHTSHDLRSPLLSIQGLVDICRNEDSLENIQRYLELMEKSAKRLDSLVINLLTLSRNTRADTQVQKVDFETQVNETVEVLNLNKPSKLQVILDIEQGSQFYSDTTRLSIILNNLVSNAFKYQNPSEANPKVKISVATTDEKAIIEVEDNGMGIAKENQARIFEMFYRATDQSHGSGLGLFIVKNVVDKLSGKINFQSTVRQGTKFTVILPNMRPS